MSVSSNTTYENDNTINDSHSIMSSVSISNMKIECPECKKELQTRSMFKHIRTLHPEYFASMFKVWKDDDFKELIDESKAFPVEWESKDDFDDTVFTNIWGCLACNSTYTVEANAHKHCKNAKCKKDHIKAMKDILKQEQKNKEKRIKQQSDTRYKYLNRTPDNIFNDTRIIIQHYIKQLTSESIKNDFIKLMNKLNPENNNDEIFSFQYNYDIKLSDNKQEMEKQENYIWKLISTIETTYKDSLNSLYYRSDIISDEEHFKLTKAIRLHNTIPKLSYD